MKIRQLNLFLAFCLGILFTCTFGWAVPNPASTGPTITRAFGPEMGKYGDPLRFYIEADDPTADMQKIAIVVDQAGYGHYPTDWVYIPEKDRHHFVGYLQWNSFSNNASKMPEWTELTVKISVVDSKGHESNAVVFPLEFVSNRVGTGNPPAPFDSPNLERLGHIDINLFNPNEMGNEPEGRW